MYNLRYHIASLVAVFLSLSIGLLLGTIVVERGTLDRQKEAIVASLQEEFRSLDAANTELRELASLREELVDTLLPAAIEDELADRRVMVIAGTGRVDGLSAVTEAIRSAGGTPVTFIFLSAGLGVDDPDVSQAVTGTVGPPAEDESPADAVVRALVAEWTTPGDSRLVTDALESAGVVRLEDDEGTEGVRAPVDAVVTLVPLADDTGVEALSLAAALAGEGLPGAGVEAASYSTGVATEAIEWGLSGVDHIGTAEGTFSLVRVLSGRATGLFGHGESATAPLPPR